MFEVNDPRVPRAAHGVLIIDNYDSFTFNLAHYVAEVTGQLPTVIVNDDAEILTDARLHEQEHLGTARAQTFYSEFFAQYAAVIVSPGPGSPSDPVALGLSAQAVALGDVPVLGVCLGFQAQVHVYGGRVGRAVEARHGRTSLIEHDGAGLFEGLSSPLEVVRYHSLQAYDVPECFMITATTVPSAPDEAPVVMALQHESFPQWGVQFHPESLCTQGGRRIVANFLHLAAEFNSMKHAVVNVLDAAPETGGEFTKEHAAETAVAVAHAGVGYQGVSPVVAREEYQDRVQHTLGLAQRPLGQRDSRDELVPSLQPVSPWLSLHAASPDAVFFQSGPRDSVAASVPSPGDFALRAAKIEWADVSEPDWVTLFETEFVAGHDGPAMWLDASSHETETGRFSVMADARGPYARILRHTVGYFNPDGTVAALDHTEIRNTHGDTLLHGEYKFFDVLSADLNRLTCDETTLDDLKLPFEFRPGWVGSIGYELHCETGATHPSAPPRVGLPDAAMFFADRALVIDHSDNAAYAVWLDVAGEVEVGVAGAGADFAERLRTAIAAGAPRPGAEGGASAPFLPPRLQHDRDAYLALIARAQERILAGDTYEVCLTNELTCTRDAPVQPSDVRLEALHVHRKLRTVSPTPFGACFIFGDTALVSSSPERFLRVSAAGVAESRPIKGTRPRGATDVEDAALKHDLATNEKDRSENLMIVDLVRNDLGRVAEPGEVHVPTEFAIETYASVHQMVSTVQATLRFGFNAVDAVKSAFPGGSMTGAPKISTMRIITELEQRRRGVYSGGVGYFGINGAADLAMVIRAAEITPVGLSLGVGGAIIAMSDPAAEFEETAVKARGVLQALGADWPQGA